MKSSWWLPGFAWTLAMSVPAAASPEVDAVYPSAALFATEVDPALHTAIGAEVAMLRDLLKTEVQ